jgi:hypothetical protein
MGRNFWLALSFANLVYLRAWTDLIPVRSGDLFLRKALPGISLYFAVAGDVLALSGLTLLLIYLAPRLPDWLQRALPVAAIALVALALRSVAPADSFLRARLLLFLPLKVLLPLAAIFGAAAVGLAFKFSSLTLRLARAAATAAIPCLAVTFVGALFYLRIQSPLPPDPPLSPRLAGSPPVRVLWILFDEWDQRLTFPNRAPGTLLPAIDGLANRSFTATRALAVQAGMPVDQMTTVDAIPSLLYGKRLVGSSIEGAGTMRLDFAGGASAVFGGGDSVFAHVRSHGWNSAVAGWYLPYCRIFASQLTDCYWDARYLQTSSASPALLKTAVDETRMLFETAQASPFGRTLEADRHSAEYAALLSAARRYAADPAIGLVFIHFNIPHKPYFYNPKTGGLGRSGYSAALYDDALELVDRSVSGILSSLNGAGLDSKTAIILSSDHPVRFPTRIDGGEDPHVPFIVHLPGQTSGVVSTQEFSTVRTADLVVAIADGEVKSPQDVEHYLVSPSAAR